jgi:hypothetical protein
MKGIEISSSKKADDTHKVKPSNEEFYKVYQEQMKELGKTPYQDLCNIGFVEDKNAQKEIIEIIEELQKIEGLVFAKVGGHDLSVRMKGRQVVKVCPLRKTWSASICGGKIQRYTKDELLGKAKAVISEESSQCSKIDEEIIKQLEERISKLSKGSKGISLKDIKLTKDIKMWAKIKGYTISGETLLVNHT